MILVNYLTRVGGVMGNDKPILSISLMTSNRKETIRKCLDSLESLRQHVSNELIIVDTGCDDEMHSIISEYTNQIVKFDWCNDFAKARNVGLKEAKGEWFLFIDDDEWFIDTDEIETFFLSGEYKNYDEACYIVRNYKDLAGTEYGDTMAYRMVRLTPETQFIGKVHENLFPKYERRTVLHSIAEHYGYAFDSEETRIKHAYRNIEPLKETIAEYPELGLWHVQLVQEYMAAGEWSHIVEFINETLKQNQGKKDETTRFYRGSLYCAMLYAKKQMYRYKDMIDLYKEYLKDKTNSFMVTSYFYGIMAEAYYKMKQYSDAKKCLDAYFLNYNSSHGQDKAYYTELIACEAFEDGQIRMNQIYLWLTDSILGNYKEARECFERLIEREITLKDEEYVREYFRIIVEAKYDETYGLCLNDLLNANGGLLRPTVYDELRKMTKPTEGLLNAINHIQGENEWVYVYQILYANQERDTARLPELFSHLFLCITDIFKIPQNVWAIGETNGVNLEEAFLQYPVDRFVRYGSIFHAHMYQNEWEERTGIIYRWKSCDDIRYELVEINRLEQSVVWGESEDCIDRERKLIDYAYPFYQKYYGDDWYQLENPEVIDIVARILSVKRKLEGASNDEK